MVRKKQIEASEPTSLALAKKPEKNHHYKRIPFGWFALVTIVLGSIIHGTLGLVLVIFGIASVIIWTVRAFRRGESKVKRWFVLVFLLIPLYAFIAVFVRMVNQ
jgi:hypothetical protein